jgi:hypothetical protein
MKDIVNDHPDSEVSEIREVSLNNIESGHQQL